MYRTALALCLVCAALLGCGDPAGSSTPAKPDPIAELEGGTPMPEGTADIQFPWMGKQSVMCVGNSFERQIAFVDFTPEEGLDMLGRAAIVGDTGTAKLIVPATRLRTGDEGRDEKLLDGAWLDAETHPDLALDLTSIERVRPTVWRAKGTFTLHGVAKPVDFLANVRYIPEMEYFGKDVIRVSARFDIDLKAHGIVNPSVGTPACAQVWTVDVAILGLMVPK